MLGSASLSHASPHQGVKLVPALCGRMDREHLYEGDHRSHHQEVMAHLREYSHQHWVSSQEGSWLGVKALYTAFDIDSQ